jgi:surface-anchored protein
VQGTPGAGEAWPGFDNKQTTSTFGSYVPSDARVSQSSAQPWIKVSLASYTPPHGKTSHFSMWNSGTLPTVWMSTFLATGSDDYYYTVGSHTHVNWGFTAQGIHQVTVQASAFRGPAATNPTPLSAPQTLIFAVGTIARWQATRFTASELQNPAISGLTADPDRDTFTNLTEYAFGLDPKKASNSPLSQGLGLPKYSITTLTGTPHHTLIYPRRKASNRLQADTYTPQFSSSLAGTWSSAGFAVTTATFPAGQNSLNTDWELVTARKPILANEPRGFCRVLVVAGDGF